MLDVNNMKHHLYYVLSSDNTVTRLTWLLINRML